MTAQAPKTETRAEQRKHVHEILSMMPDVMFLTYEETGPRPVQKGRPLHVTHLDDDGGMWFMVALDSRKVQDLRGFDQAMVTGQHDSRWIELAGTGVIVTDRTRIRQLWNKLHEAWFPLGSDDPNVCLIHFQPHHAEYWDNSGMVGVKYLFEVAKALVTGQAADDVKGTHGKTEGRVSSRH